MGILGLLKRFIPFLLTFAAGLLIASFFVPLTFPGSRMRAKKEQHKKWHDQIERENNDLRQENADLKREIESLKGSAFRWHGAKDWSDDLPVVNGLPDVPPPPPIPVAPIAPAAPKRAR
jgi:hypothetical protein